MSVLDVVFLVAEAVVETVGAQIAAKSIATMADDFAVRLSEAVTDFFNRENTAADVRGIMRQLIKSYAYDEYYEGMREGGVDDPEAEISDGEDAEVSAWITEQLGYVDGFIDALKDTRKGKDEEEVGARQDAINARVDQWRGSMANLGSMGKAAALKNRTGKWKLGPTEEHCQSKDGKMGCAELNGKRHRVSWFLDRGYIPQQNGNEEITCGGWKCLCEIVADNDDVLMP